MVRTTQDSETANDRGESAFSGSRTTDRHRSDREIPAYTRDLSNRGVYFYLASDDGGQLDQDFEFLVELPPEITLRPFAGFDVTGEHYARKSPR